MVESLLFTAYLVLCISNGFVLQEECYGPKDWQYWFWLVLPAVTYLIGYYS